jgi:RNA polymerase sigma-70 factor, ECF subfamily
MFGKTLCVPTEIERLYLEHRARLVRLVERELHDPHDAEDVVQTAFLDAQRALEHGTIPRNPRAWLAAIALNAGRRLRRRRLNAEPLEEYAAQEGWSGTSEIRSALASLPKEQRAAVVYRDLLGFSYGETAKQMGKSVNAVTMLLHRGRQRLRQTLGLAAGGFGLWRWLKQAGLPQATVVKGTVAVVAATSLATAGIVTARVVAQPGPDVAAPLTTHSGSLMAAAGRTPEGTHARESARDHGKSSGGSRTRASHGQAQGSLPSVSTSMGEAQLSTSILQAPTPSVSAPSTPTVAATVAVSSPIATTAATVTLTSPIATPTVTIPTGVTATTPATTVTLPVP